MLNVKIYCPTTHPDYEETYQVIEKVLQEQKIKYIIERINRMEDLYRLRILYPPQIVINGRIVYNRRCPLKEEILQILEKMNLINKHNKVSISPKE